LFSSFPRCSLCAIFNCNWKRKASKKKLCDHWLQLEEKSIKKKIMQLLIATCREKHKREWHQKSDEQWVHTYLSPHRLPVLSDQTTPKKQAKHMLETSTTMRHIYIYYNSNVKTPWFFFSSSCVCMERRSSRLFWHKPEWRTQNAANDLNLCILICYSGWWSKHCSRQKREQSEDPSSVKRLGTWLQIPM
jgi:hypothetical protein